MIPTVATAKPCWQGPSAITKYLNGSHNPRHEAALIQTLRIVASSSSADSEAVTIPQRHE